MIKPIRVIWDEMTLDKGDLLTRCENYARLTLPHICAPSGLEKVEQEKGNVDVGSTLVNHLASKVVDVIFPHGRAFFVLNLKPEAKDQLIDEAGKDEVNGIMAELREETQRFEELAMSKMQMLKYRPMATEAVKHAIVTGNSLIRRLPDGTRVVYGIRDYGVFRNINGDLYDIVVRDETRFDALDKEVQARVRNDYRGTAYKDEQIVSMFTRWRKKDNRWEQTQSVDEVPLGTFKMVADKDMPCIVLAWSLGRAENYGRGLVEDNIVTFHSLDVLTSALLDMFGIMADIKFLVNPASALEPEELQNSPRGSYHYGRKDDITSPELDKRSDSQIMEAKIASLTQMLSRVFLYSSGGIRDAERVTAEEIRFYARELEAAFGGIYSRLALVWQAKEADWALRQIGKDIPSMFEPSISAGMESLTKESMLEAVRLSLNDLALLQAIPEDMREVMDNQRLARFIFVQRNVPIGEFLRTPEEIQQRAQQRQQQQQQLMQAEAAAKTTQAAGEAAVQEASNG